MGRFIVAVTTNVNGAHPQANVMAPPWVTAVFNALNVQLAAVPSPTTVAFDVSAACPVAGMATLHATPALPAVGVDPQPPSVPDAPVAALVPLVPLVPLAPVTLEAPDVGPLVAGLPHPGARLIVAPNANPQVTRPQVTT
jgi:hypothetical protein